MKFGELDGLRLESFGRQMNQPSADGSNTTCHEEWENVVQTVKAKEKDCPHHKQCIFTGA